MNTFRTIGVVFVVCLSLLINLVACGLIGVSLKRQPDIRDADLVIAGVGNSGNDIVTGASPRRLVRRVMEQKAAPEITDAMLQATTTALIERARQGDPEAAAFVFDLAAAQREKAQQQQQQQPTTTAPTSGDKQQ